MGIDNITAADGLAVGRASGFVGRAMERLIDGYYTIDDQELYNLLSLLNKEEGIQLEPSALAGMTGAIHVSQAKDYLQGLSLDSQKMHNATHLVWATGAVWCQLMKCKNILRKGNSNHITIKQIITL